MTRTRNAISMIMGAAVAAAGGPPAYAQSDCSVTLEHEQFTADISATPRFVWPDQGVDPAFVRTRITVAPFERANARYDTPETGNFRLVMERRDPPRDVADQFYFGLRFDAFRLPIVEDETPLACVYSTDGGWERVEEYGGFVTSCSFYLSELAEAAGSRLDVRLVNTDTDEELFAAAYRPAPPPTFFEEVAAAAQAALDATVYNCVR